MHIYKKLKQQKSINKVLGEAVLLTLSLVEDLKKEIVLMKTRIEEEEEEVEEKQEVPQTPQTIKCQLVNNNLIVRTSLSHGVSIDCHLFHGSRSYSLTGFDENKHSIQIVQKEK